MSLIRARCPGCKGVKCSGRGGGEVACKNTSLGTGLANTPQCRSKHLTPAIFVRIAAIYVSINKCSCSQPADNDEYKRRVDTIPSCHIGAGERNVDIL
jgi:hypothetical protein